MSHRSLRMMGLIAAGLLAGACGRKANQAADTEGAGAPAESALTPFELENGIGPVTEAIAVGDVDPAMAARGEKVFTAKCSACHKLDARYVGPALGQVTDRRTPTYVMNMILNPEGMYNRHPVARQLLGQFMTQMPNLNLTREEARDVLEYFRSARQPETGK